MKIMAGTSFVFLVLVLQCVAWETEETINEQFEDVSSRRHQNYGAKETDTSKELVDFPFAENALPEMEGEQVESAERFTGSLDSNDVETENNAEADDKNKKGSRNSKCRTSFIKRRKDRMETFQKELLQKLGISSPPNIRRADIDNLLDYQKLTRILSVVKSTLKEGEDSSETVSQYQRYLPSCNVPRRTTESAWNDGSSYRLYFDLNTVTQPSADIHAAALQLYKRPLQGEVSRCISLAGDYRDHLTITLLAYTRPVRTQRPGRFQVITRTQVAPSMEGWLKFDILETVHKWTRNFRNFGLAVRVEDCYGFQIPPSEIFDKFKCNGALKELNRFEDINKNVNLNSPNLEILTTSSLEMTKSRHKRDVTSETLQCVKENLWVNLTEQYEFILAPPYVNIGMCVTRGSGTTPNNLSCDATGWTPLDVIYVKDDKGSIIHGQVTNIIVNECSFVTQRRSRLRFRPVTRRTTRG